VVLASVLSGSTDAFNTEVKTCCPPGQFLAIDDWQGSRQSVEGVWYSKDYSGSARTLFRQYHDWLPMMQVNNLGPPGMGPSGGKSPLRFGRHDYITGVSCVPNEKNLPPIDGFQRSSDSSLPEFATWEDREDNRKLYSNRSHPLAEGQVLKSTGHQFPLDSCPVQALSTMVLGDGRSNGFIDRPRQRYAYAYSSAFLRINATGRLVGQHMDEIGLSNLRMGRELPEERHSGGGPRKEPQLPPPAEETDLGVDFCLTWSTDPRITTTTLADLTKEGPGLPRAALSFGGPGESEAFDEYMKRGGPLQLLEAVYCDPCKAKVVCSLVTKDVWPMLRFYIDPSDDRSDPYSPNLWFLIPYLDSDKDGKVTVGELYEGRVVGILRSIFDGLDVNGNKVLEKSEAIPENLFRRQFIRNIFSEIFELVDRNKDGFLSVDDVPPLYCQRSTDCVRIDPDCSQMSLEDCYQMYPSKAAMEGRMKMKKIEDYCYTLYSTYSDEDKLQECKTQISTYLPLLDRNGDSRLTLAEIVDPVIRLVQFLVGEPGKLLGVDEIVSGLERLGESPEVTNPLRQYLRPALATFPMKILQELVSAGDLDGDGGLNWEEFEGFGNFEFAANWFGFARCKRQTRPYEGGCRDWVRGISTEVATLFDGMQLCNFTPSRWSNGREIPSSRRCFPASADKENLRKYFSEPKVLQRLLRNLLYHKDFLFPSWQE